VTERKLPFTCQILVSTQPMIGEQFQPSFTGNPHNPGDHSREDCFINNVREDHQTPTVKEESKIPILLDYILDNPSQGSQIPLGVLKSKHLFLSKGKFLTLLKVNLVTLLKGKLVIHLKIVKLTILP
jgi:hypothetical protein